MLPLYILSKICSGPLKPIKSIGLLFRSLKVYFKLLKSILAEFFISASPLRKQSPYSAGFVSFGFISSGFKATKASTCFFLGLQLFFFSKAFPKGE